MAFQTILKVGGTAGVALLAGMGIAEYMHQDEKEEWR